MTRIPVGSNHIKSIGHNSMTGTLEVEFRNGHVYQYPDVQRHDFVRIMAHPSKGSAFHAIVASRKNGVKI